MGAGLPVSDLINVSVSLSPPAAQGPNLNALLIMGATDAIDPGQRIRAYPNITAVGADLGVAAPEYLAATLYFEQSPQPSQLYIGRWAARDTPGLLRGAPLSAAAQAIANWTTVANGSFTVTIDGVVVNVTGLNFTAQTNLNGIAAIITASLGGAGVCTWNGSQFIISSISAGAGKAAAATITLTTNPAAGDTLTVAGTQITFVATAPVGNQVVIGDTTAVTAANLQLFLAGSTDANLVRGTYSTALNITTVTAAALGAAGNILTMATSNPAAITLSAALLSGGANPSTVSYVAPAGVGQDLSEQLGLTATVASPLIAGVAAESPLEAIQVVCNTFSSRFLGIVFADTSITDQQHLDIASFIEADQKHLYGVTTQEGGVIDSTNVSDLASQMKAMRFKYSFVDYCSTNPYGVASLFGRLLTVNFNANNTTLTLMYKTEPGVVAETISESQWQALKSKNCNVYVEYDNDTAIIQPGITCSGLFIDSIYNVIWFRNALQTAVYNLLYMSPTKVPQTDDGNHLIKTTIEAVCNAATNNGYLGPGQWNSQGFGTISQGDFLPKGWYCYAPPISQQSQADRGARKSVPFQVAAKEAGAIHSVDILVSVNQ